MRCFRSWRVALFAMAATLLFSHSATAAPILLQMDFGSAGDPSPLQPGFTNVSGLNPAATANTTVGAYTIGLQGQGFFNTTNTATVNLVPTGVRNFYRDYYYNNNAPNSGQGVTLSVGGLTPNIPYNLTVWSYDPGASTTVATVTNWNPLIGSNTTGGSGTISYIRAPQPSALTEKSATFQVISTTDTIEVFGTTSAGASGTRLNGFRINDGTTDLLSVDFAQQALPSLVQTDYVGAMGFSNTSSHSQVEGPYTVKLAGQGFFSSTDAQAASIPANVRDFYRDYYYNNNQTPGEGVTLEIEGVTPDTWYDLTLWSYDANLAPAAGTPTSWTPTGDTTGQSATILNKNSPFPTAIDGTENQATIRVKSSTSTLTVFGTVVGGGAPTTGGTRLNGIRLTAVPEPSTLALISIALATTAFARRRQR